MIPKNIKREHIIKAMLYVDEFGVPRARESHKFQLEYNEKFYPPKYIVSIANKYANGEELNFQEFSGGIETNKFLLKCGFNVIDISTGNAVSSNKSISMVTENNKVSLIHSGERCKNCKNTVKSLLEKIFGEVHPNYRFKDVGTRPEDFERTPYYEDLKRIYKALQNYRGFGNFVRSSKLPNADYFVPNSGLVVEFDESQHFTEARRISLENYPKNIKLGFSKEKWIELCNKVRAKDNDPPYRDEQRAWYDTLRDFVPLIKGLKPTIRLYAKEYVWCNDFRVNNISDIKRFEQLLFGQSEKWDIEIKEETNPIIGRVIVSTDWKGDQENCIQLLDEVCKKWLDDRKVKILMTCGGFIQFPWPKNLSRNEIGDNKNSNDAVISTLVAEAEKYVNSVLNPGICKELSRVTRYVTIGIDSFKEIISTNRNRISQSHVELVFIKDLEKNELYWTGKSYPTTSQQRGLVRIVNLKKHFFNLDIGKVMVLGCHDLTIFNPRSDKTIKGWRKEVKEEFKNLAKQENTVYVLHHPHTTVKIRTWLNAWNSLLKMLPSVKYYAGSGRYFEPDVAEMDALDEVLNATKNTDTIDFVIYDKKQVK